MWFISRRRHEQQIADLRERLNQAIEQRDDARTERAAFKLAAETAARQFAEADAAARRTADRNLRLGEQLAALAEGDPAYAAALEQRVARLLKVGERILAAYTAQTKRASHLQKCLDDAVGLGGGRIVDSRAWQPGYEAPKADAS